jgi:hypothetical protein
MTIGTIDAGPSVALTQAASELARIITEIQNSELEAATMMMKGQQKMAQASASATIEAGQQAANMAWAEAATAAVSIVTSVGNFASSASATAKTDVAGKTYESKMTNLKGCDDHLTRPVNEAVLRPAHAAADRDPLIESRLKNTKTALEEHKNISTFLDQDGTSLLQDHHYAQLTITELDDLKTTVAEQKAAVKKEYEQQKEAIKYSTETFSSSLKIVDSAATFSAKMTVADAQGKKANAEAEGQIAQNAGLTLQQACTELLAIRKQKADEVSKIFNDKNQAVQAANYRA